LGRKEYETLKAHGLTDQHLLSIVDINEETELPNEGGRRRKNKNDFYRYLLEQTSQSVGVTKKANNDILIPRSILKFNGEQKGKVKKQFLQQPAQDEYIEENEAVFGRKLRKNDPLLSPKLIDILKEDYLIEQSKLAELSGIAANNQLLAGNELGSSAEQHETELEIY